MYFPPSRQGRQPRRLTIHRYIVKEQAGSPPGGDGFCQLQLASRHEHLFADRRLFTFHGGDGLLDGRQFLLDPVGPPLTQLGPLDTFLGFILESRFGPLPVDGRPDAVVVDRLPHVERFGGPRNRRQAPRRWQRVCSSSELFC